MDAASSPGRGATTELTLPLWVSPFSVRAVYEELNSTLTAIDEQEDLRWWRSRHGPGMPTDWPHFQVGLRHPDPRRPGLEFRAENASRFFFCEGVEA